MGNWNCTAKYCNSGVLLMTGASVFGEADKIYQIHYNTIQYNIVGVLDRWFQKWRIKICFPTTCSNPRQATPPHACEYEAIRKSKFDEDGRAGVRKCSCALALN
jgi:hypothetical protein